MNFLHITLSQIWLAIGFLGQICFGMRFIIQWIVSEKVGQSIIPKAFWYFSFIGGLMLFAYAIWKKDPVFIVSQGLGLIVYSRNLYLILVKKKKDLNTNE